MVGGSARTIGDVGEASDITTPLKEVHLREQGVSSRDNCVLFYLSDESCVSQASSVRCLSFSQKVYVLDI